MFQHSSHKKCFTIESLVGKEAGGHGGGPGDEPIRPTALRFPESLHPAAGIFGSCFQGGGGRTLYSSGPDMVLQEPGPHTQSPGGLPLHPLQIPPQSFFSPQHRDALSFYPWVLRSRYLGHRFQDTDAVDSHFACEYHFKPPLATCRPPSHGLIVPSTAGRRRPTDGFACGAAFSFQPGGGG
ncbi:unnamed protein product [Pleuronectes platessa]|uniref:Homeobox protein EMX1 n=1 Tax=Pleuronectes platessa TaxID=8262 RepID=A0A9N7THW8_PLEPL|nr:unnamed protein product [Pleuronectes platessa]